MAGRLYQSPSTDFYVPTIPDYWVAPWTNVEWTPSGDYDGGLADLSLGFGLHVVNVVTPGSFTWRITPQWLVATGTERLAMQALDGAGDVIGVIATAFVPSGVEWTGSTGPVPAGRRFRVLAGDDVGESVGQYLLANEPPRTTLEWSEEGGPDVYTGPFVVAEAAPAPT